MFVAAAARWQCVQAGCVEDGRWRQVDNKLARKDPWAFTPVCHVLLRVGCVDCTGWAAPTNRGAPALPADPPSASSGLSQPVSGSELLTLLPGRKGTVQAIANGSHWGGIASAKRAKDGIVTAGVCPGPGLSCLSMYLFKILPFQPHSGKSPRSLR